MNKIFSSASKIVFLLLTLTACIGFFAGKLEPKDFMLLAVSAFSFYFSSKGEIATPASSTSTTVSTTESLPYAGK